MKKHFESIDIAKAIGIFCIVLGHVLKSGMIRSFLNSFHVQLFFFLSGLCMSAKTNREYIKKQIKRLYIPYVLVSVISIIIYCCLAKYIKSEEYQGPLYSIISMLYANSNLFSMEWNNPLWFLPCLFIVSVFSNFVENLIREKKTETVSIIRLIESIMLFAVGAYLGKNNIYLPFQAETAMCMILFFNLGICTKEKMISIDNKISKLNNKWKFIMLVISIIMVGIDAFVYLNTNRGVSIRQDIYNNYLIFIVIAIFMIINVMIISKLCCHYVKKRKLLNIIGKNTLIIMLLHKFPIIVFQKILPVTKNILNGKESIIQITLAIFLSVITILICLLIQHFLNRFKTISTKNIKAL